MDNDYTLIPNGVFDADLTTSEFVVLVTLFAFANGNYTCNPSIAIIAHTARITTSTATKALAGLRNKGLISWERRPNVSNVYTINRDRF